MQYDSWTAHAQDTVCRLAIVLDCLRAVSLQSAASKIFFNLGVRQLIHTDDTGDTQPAGVEKIDSARYHCHSFLPGRHQAFNNHDFNNHNFQDDVQAICRLPIYRPPIYRPPI